MTEIKQHIFSSHGKSVLSEKEKQGRHGSMFCLNVSVLGGVAKCVMLK